MRIKSILLLLVCFLLSGLTMQVIACPNPDCGSCCHWVSTGPGPSDGYCELNTGAECGDCQGGCYNPCNNCVSCSCEWDCSPGQSCCNDTCCDSGNCCNSTTCCSNSDDVCCTDAANDYCCPSDYTCCQGSCCDPIGKCEICLGGVQCVNGCIFYYNCLKCDGEGQCVTKCDNTQCCHQDTCIDKCDPDGGATCTWTNPPVLDPLCEYLQVGSRECLNPGDSCSWEVDEGPRENAVCAPCAPGCTLGSTYCVKLKPIKCEDSLTWLPPFIDCTCTGPPASYVPEPAGTRDVCP